MQCMKAEGRGRKQERGAKADAVRGCYPTLSFLDSHGLQYFLGYLMSFCRMKILKCTVLAQMLFIFHPEMLVLNASMRGFKLM